MRRSDTPFDQNLAALRASVASAGISRNNRTNRVSIVKRESPAYASSIPLLKRGSCPNRRDSKR
jgi:hypothetical protein